MARGRSDAAALDPGPGPRAHRAREFVLAPRAGTNIRLSSRGPEGFVYSGTRKTRSMTAEEQETKRELTAEIIAFLVAE